MLALLEFFWGEWPEGSSGGSSSSSTAAPVAVINLGSKKGEDIAWLVEPALEPRAPEDFWEARAAYLLRLKEAAERRITHESVVEAVAIQSIAPLVAERERAYRAAELAETAAELKAQAALVAKLTMEIVAMKAKRAQEDEDLVMLLLLM